MGFRFFLSLILLWSLSFLCLQAGETDRVLPWDEQGAVQYRPAPEALIAQWKADPAYDYERQRKPGWWQHLWHTFLRKISLDGADLSWLSYVLKGLVALAFVYFVLRMLNVPLGGLLTAIHKNKGRFVGVPESGREAEEGGLEERWLLCRSTGAYREATRLLYLQLLKSLQQAGLIHIKSGKTNREYLRELHTVGLYEDLAPLVRIYDYVWFGQVQPDERHYQWIEDAFTGHLNRLKKVENHA